MASRVDFPAPDGPRMVTKAPSPMSRAIRPGTQLRAAPGLAQVFNAPTDLLLSSTPVVQPDLIVIGAGRVSIITERAVEGIPDIVVEILSATSLDRDQHIKRRLYQQFAVPEYWLVDPEY